MECAARCAPAPKGKAKSRPGSDFDGVLDPDPGQTETDVPRVGGPSIGIGLKICQPVCSVGTGKSPIDVRQEVISNSLPALVVGRTDNRAGQGLSCPAKGCFLSNKQAGREQ